MTGEEAKNALLKGSPVVHKNIVYKRIQAIRYTRDKGKIAISLELLDRNKKSVSVVPIKEAEIYQE